MVLARALRLCHPPANRTQGDYTLTTLPTRGTEFLKLCHASEFYGQTHSARPSRVGGYDDWNSLHNPWTVKAQIYLRRPRREMS
jgi:hypothetical protein